MMKKCISLHVWLILTFAYRSVTGAGLYKMECIKDFESGSQGYDSFCLTSLLPIQSKSCNKADDVMSVKDFTLYIPNKNIDLNECKEVKEFYYKTTINSACLMNTSQSEVKQFLLPVMEEYTGKRRGETNLSANLDYMRNKWLFGLPKFSQLRIQYRCKEKTTLSMDICEDRNTSDRYSKVHIGFNASLYNSSDGPPACSCVITSMKNESKINVQAFDVRLAGHAILSLFGTRKKVIDSSELFWEQDGILAQHPEEVRIDLSNLDPSHLPPSVWLQIEGQELSIKCNQSWPKPDFKNLMEDSDDLWYIILATVIVGILALLLLAVFLKCVCKRSRSISEEYAMVDSGNTSPIFKNNNCTPIKANHLEHETTKDNEDSSNSNNYFEVEPQLNSSRANDSFENNIYSHLRDNSDIDPPGHIYDCVSSEYSTLNGRREPKTITDNIYNS